MLNVIKIYKTEKEGGGGKNIPPGRVLTWVSEVHGGTKSFDTFDLWQIIQNTARICIKISNEE